MRLESFLAELIAKGRVTLASSEPVAPGDAGAAQGILVELDARARRDAPGEAPPFSSPAATWAARLLYRGCQCFAYRDLEAEQVARDLAEPCPAPRGQPSTVWSADLTLRWLPDVFSLARGVADRDPLLDSLRGLARAWPLSSVGVPGLVGIDPSSLLADDCLRRLYVDRILAREDPSRLEHPVVADAVRAALGLHLDLSANLARALEATP